MIFMMLQEVLELEPYDLVIADEAWDVDNYRHEKPQAQDQLNGAGNSQNSSAIMPAFTARRFERDHCAPIIGR
ncbi:MAG: hypothetical protein GY798_33740 [Hyphomicrobiales bacterium]|nr:hypothetical protein [Hyphomicrobiales bacterium]